MPYETVTLNVNGSEKKIEVEPRDLLLDVLRDGLNLTGAKRGCDQGVCGACTVILEGKAICSCMIFAVEADGKAISTIEGLEKDGELDPIQKAFIREDALQCGFCTSGQIMSGKGFLMGVARGERVDDGDIKEALSGNLCRCGCYNKIFDAVKSVLEERAGGLHP